MSPYETMSVNFLGGAPTHIAEEDLLDYFLYVFEFNWTSSAFDGFRKDIEQHFSGFYQGICDKYPDLPLGKRWWSLILFGLKDFSDYEKFIFSSETIQSLLSNLGEIDEDDLREYCNSTDRSFANDMPECLSVRPSEIEKLCSDAYRDDHALRFFLDRKDQFVRSFKSSLIQKDINSIYTEKFMINSDRITRKFTNFWHAYFDIFVGYSIAMYDMMLQSEEMAEDDLRRLLKQTSMAYLIASVNNTAKIESLNKKIVDLIMPLYLEQLHK